MSYPLRGSSIIPTKRRKKVCLKPGLSLKRRPMLPPRPSPPPSSSSSPLLPLLPFLLLLLLASLSSPTILCCWFVLLYEPKWLYMRAEAKPHLSPSPSHPLSLIPSLNLSPSPFLLYIPLSLSLSSFHFFLWPLSSFLPFSTSFFFSSS